MKLRRVDPEEFSGSLCQGTPIEIDLMGPVPVVFGNASVQSMLINVHYPLPQVESSVILSVPFPSIQGPRHRTRSDSGVPSKPASNRLPWRPAGIQKFGNARRIDQVCWAISGKNGDKWGKGQCVCQGAQQRLSNMWRCSFPNPTFLKRRVTVNSL